MLYQFGGGGGWGVWLLALGGDVGIELVTVVGVGWLQLLGIVVDVVEILVFSHPCLLFFQLEPISLKSLFG